MRAPLALAALLALFCMAPPADAAIEPSPDASGNAFFVEYQTAVPASNTLGEAPGIAANQGYESSGTRYELRNPCGVSINSGAPICPQNTCEPDAEIFRVVAVSAGGETPRGLTCVGESAGTIAAAAPPQVTDAMVLEAFRRVPVPELRSVTQPGDKTLVNFDTIFFAEADGFSRTVSILGRSVRLDVAPESFRWEFGDGTSATTATAGAPYPSKDVVHRYADAQVTVQHRVAVTWGATWSLDGGAPRPVPGTVTTTGPTTALRVAEAVPALSGRR